MSLPRSLFFFFNDTATTEIYTLSLHDALPICDKGWESGNIPLPALLARTGAPMRSAMSVSGLRSEEHTSELQSQSNLVCRLLLEKKKHKTHEPYVLLRTTVSLRVTPMLLTTAH